MSTAERRKLSEKEFLELERSSKVRNQLWNGEVFAMTGGTRQHASLITRLGGTFDRLVSARGCETYVADMRVFVPREHGYTYPDVVVACGPKFGEGPADTLLNPSI